MICAYVNLDNWDHVSYNDVRMMNITKIVKSVATKRQYRNI